MRNRDDGETVHSGRRRVLRWLAAAPGAFALGQGLSACDSSTARMGRDGSTADASPGDGGPPRDGGAAGDGGDAAAPDAAASCEATTSDALGPFFEEGAPMRTKLAEDEPGEPLRIEGRLLRASECRTPLGGYGLDLWQADREGNYHEPPDYRLRGRMVTKEDGTFAFETIMPGNYRLGGSFRPAHIHFRVYSPQGEVLLTSQLYFEGDPYLGEEDPCQPPNCFSNDADRIIRLMPATLDGQSGKMGMIPLFVETG